MIRKAIRYFLQAREDFQQARATAEALVWHHGAEGEAFAWKKAWKASADETLTPREWQYWSKVACLASDRLEALERAGEKRRAKLGKRWMSRPRQVILTPAE